MADQQAGPPRTRVAEPHENESSQDKSAENMTYVDWGSCDSLTSDGHRRGNEDEA